MIRFLLITVLFQISCQQHKPSCNKNKTSVFFDSYLDTISSTKNATDKTNLKIDVLAKYQLNGSVKIVPLEDAIVVLKSTGNKSYSELSNNNGQVIFDITNKQKADILIKYYGYKKFEKKLFFKPNHNYNIRVVLGIEQ